MHHQSVNKSPSLFSLAAIRSMVSSVFKRSAFHDVVIPAKAGIPSPIPNTVPHSQFPHLSSFSLFPASFIIPLPSPVIPDHTPVIPPGVAYGRSPAYTGISQIPASRRNVNVEIHPHSVPPNFNFSILNFQFPSIRFLLTLLILPFIFALDLFYFTLARPGCAACGSLSGFLADSSLTVALIPANSEIMNWIRMFKSKVIV